MRRVAALPGTDWTVTAVQEQGLPANTIFLLRFTEATEWDDLPDGTMRLNAVSHPCFSSMELVYIMSPDTDANGTAKTTLEITDASETENSEIVSCPFYETENQDEKDALVAISQSFVDSLLKVKSFTITDDSLDLHNATGATVVQLISCDTESELAGTGWHPYKIYPSDAPAISLTPQQQQSMSAKFEGCSISGSSGCNSYGADYKINADADPSEISFTDFFSTMMYCEGDNVMDLESAYLSALGQTTAYKLSANATHEMLHFMDAEGNSLVSFVPCVSPSVFGHTWTANGIGNTSRNTGKSMKFTFQDNGVLQVQTACRNTEMEYSYDSDAMTISVDTPEAWDPPSETACDRADFEEDFQHENAIEEEGELLEALGSIASFDIDACSGSLRLSDAAGNIVLSMTIVDSSSDPSDDPSTGAVAIDGGPSGDSDTSVVPSGEDPPEDSTNSGRDIVGGLVGFAWMVPLLAAVVL